MHYAISKQSEITIDLEQIKYIFKVYREPCVQFRIIFHAIAYEQNLENFIWKIKILKICMTLTKSF